ncbi:GNAT family N-acetyltransferase [Mumia sp. zg.B53]|uniref:GNAT family N-acetyltransferase n=1 Tax=unclassified Mumia TaxID=2621872 RepID=UPI001C6E9D93|nr:MULTISPECIES: GNAT family N-acetyltransferase [unclassified Mumia]MBW9205072.1 GNAT family N-acetyltransferase [Mumia sp. zg.B17]MBW9208924.1 GNAT family N-acetyltransferase [Mumia sp. zg.B21]MBW9213536.1 GNAT family N-acetyltransferase [Mumia sp. zg.B53]MDD9349279.1 GNAT family N-acetyltransferase [Mumia sp.]
MADLATFTVRRVTDPEPELLDSLHALITELVEEGAALGWLEPPSRSDVGDLLGDLVQESDLDDACLAVAEDAEGGVVGFAYWSRRMGETEQPHADIGRVAVSSRARGAGLGRRLVGELIDYARKSGIEILTLDVRGNNHAAMALYERLGFQEYGRIPDFVAIGDQRWDNVYFWLDLRTDEHDLTLHGDTPTGPGASEVR